MTRTLPFLIGLILCGCVSTLLNPDPRTIPLDRVRADRRDRIRKILESEPVEITIPRTEVKSSLEVYEFLMEELPFTSDVVRALGKGKYEIFRDKPHPGEGPRERKIRRHRYHLNDKRGMYLAADLVYTERGKWVYYLWGYQKSPFGDIPGEAVVVVTASNVTGVLETEARVFVPIGKFTGGLVEDIIKKKASIFIEAAQTVTEAANEDPVALYEKIRDADGIDRQVLREFKTRFLDR